MKSLFLFILMSLTIEASLAYDLKVNALGRVRYESLSNSDYNSASDDYKSFTGSRFIFTSELTEGDYKIFFQPQFTKTWGLNDGAFGTSGTTRDTSLNVHQGFIYFPAGDFKNLNFKLGRQELSYGDELILGSVIWSNVGRSFDAAKLEWQIGNSRLDIFSSKMVDLNSSTPDVGDKDLNGIYFSGKNDVSLIKETDLYVLNLNDSTVTTKVDLVAYGLRIKGDKSLFDYRFELTMEDINSNNEYQGDLEAGFTFSSIGRFALNYFSSSDGFNQLYPTAHKWLGIGDSLSRRNLSGFQVKHNLRWTEKLNSEFSYFQFFRQNNQVTAFNFIGAGAGNAALESKDIGSELNLILNYLQSTQLSYQLGGALFVPGDYYKQSNLVDDYLFFYLQVTLKI